MRVLDLIAAKRDGATLTAEAITALVQGFTNDTIPDYQMAAFLMAVFFRGMTAEETAALTMAMAASGKILDLSGIDGIKVDKHSTGGVADTTTLVVAPLVAAAGVPVAKMSGRGLGFTGGTIDKLEAIPGFRTQLSEAEFIGNLRRHQIAVTRQTGDIAPADGKIYALRDATATVESIPLIASSIMSKKIAVGADKILLDVKVGNGAFMKTLDDAIELAKTMVAIGRQVGRETVAVLTAMDQPLGQAVGNSLEVAEAIDILAGRKRGRLYEVCLTLATHMLLLGQAADSAVAAREKLERLLASGAALAKFQEFIAAQGGDPAVAFRPELLPAAQLKLAVASQRRGYVQRIDPARIGNAAMLLGAGREKKGDAIDFTVGLTMQVEVGDFVEQGQPLAVIHANDPRKAELAQQNVLAAISLGDDTVPPLPLLLGIVDEQGYCKIS